MVRKSVFLLCLTLVIFAIGSRSYAGPIESGGGGSLKMTHRVNVPHFDGDIIFSERAILWFGAVDKERNYADVRIGYNDDKLIIHSAVFDRRLWYDQHPATAAITRSDAVTIYLDLEGGGADIDGRSYRIDLGANMVKNDVGEHVAVYVGDNGLWRLISTNIESGDGWRGSGFNDMSNDRGWTAVARIPFAALGLSGAPAEGTVWRLGMRLHDRDDAAASQIAVQQWPAGVDANTPSTWGELGFGMPSYASPPSHQQTLLTIREGENGVHVVDAEVGGHTSCGADVLQWTEWGDKNRGDSAEINVQNQGDVADWPCFSKFYLAFPLSQVPAGMVITRAELVLDHFGNAGNVPGGPWASYIQVFEVTEPWQEGTISWNNAPRPRQNIGATRVDPYHSQPSWPASLVSWDVTQIVAAAYADGRPASMALYSADKDYSSGKYFRASDVPDAEWTVESRPRLKIVYGLPGQGPVYEHYLPLVDN